MSAPGVPASLSAPAVPKMVSEPPESSQGALVSSVGRVERKVVPDTVALPSTIWPAVRP